MFSIVQGIGTSLLLSLMLVSTDARREKRSNCDDKYYDVTPSHTMCLDDNIAAVSVDLTQEDKDEIVKMHNEIRANVSDAANMRKLTWDDRLAAVAHKWAMQCVGGHDEGKQRSEPDLPGFVGQNLAWGHFVDHTRAVNLWAGEIKDFEYGIFTKETGHYIQQIFADTTLVGCGRAKCDGISYVVCNYHLGTIGKKPYLRGSPCDKCPESCQGGLCVVSADANREKTPTEKKEEEEKTNEEEMTKTEEETKMKKCDDKYYDVTSSHIMCLDDNIAAVSVDMTQEVKDEIVYLHNMIRANVSDAANMRKLKWDDRLAAVAHKWAMQCFGGRSSFNQRSEPDLPGFVGQKVARGISLVNALTLWAKEIEDFDYERSSCISVHYIPQIFASTSLLGCGQAKCGNTNYVVCHYYVGPRSYKPYLLGSPCDKCPQSCLDGLCDCTSGPDACFNGGTYDIDSCSCKCNMLWNGATCTNKNCPQEDVSFMCTAPCIMRWCVFDHFKGLCPVACGLCPDPNNA